MDSLRPAKEIENTTDLPTLRKILVAHGS
jgi:hypothetical protein